MSENTEHTAPEGNAPTKHAGGCHCGAVRFEALVDATAGTRCNCTICTKLDPLSARVPPASLVVLSGDESLSSYEWGSRSARRYFCKHCGVYCFGRGYVAAMGGDFASVNLNTLDGLDPREVKVTYWDGRNNNWQAGARATPWPLAATPKSA